MQRYRARVSGPLLDRIDLVVEVPRLQHKELLEGGQEETSSTIRQRIIAARLLQRGRLSGTNLHCNAHMGPKELNTLCVLKDAEQRLIAKAMQTYNLSGRACARLLRVARTIADLAREEQINSIHLAEALQYRTNGIKNTL